MALSSVTPRQFKNVIVVTVLLPLILLATLAGILVWQIKHLLDAAQQVSRSNEVISHANNLQRFIIDMETGVRGYLFTGDRIFLDPYEKALLVIDPAFESLNNLVADEPKQIERLKTINLEYTAWNSHTSEIMRSRENNDIDQARLIALKRKRLMDDIRVQFAAFIETEEDLRNQRNQTVQEATRTAVYTAVGLTIFLGCVLGLAIWHQFNKVSHVYENALIQEQEGTKKLEKSRQALEESEKRYRLLFESNPLPMWVFDRHTLFSCCQ